MGRTLSLALAALNGAVGDHLARTNNGLATEMTFVRDDEPLPLEQFAKVYRDAAPRVSVLVHGLMCTEDVFRFPESGEDYGSLLLRDFGIQPLHVRYNTGLAVTDNGASLSALLDGLLSAYPRRIEEILLLGYSMGGLVVRAACHSARMSKSPWLSLVSRAVYVGTPHQGAPLERAGRALSRLLEGIPDPYTRLVADIANLRSVGVKDLGDPLHPVPLLPEIRHFLVAGALSSDPLVAKLFGDALVPVPSATHGGCTALDELVFPVSHLKVLPGIGHVGLAHHPDVYAAIRGFLEEAT